MPVFLIPLLFAAILFILPTFAPSAPPPVALPAAVAIELHYTRGGIVQINRNTGATRYTPYRLAGPLDRRARLRT